MRKVIDLIGLNAGATTLAVAATGTVYSRSFPLPMGDPSFAFEYQFASGGTVETKLELEQGNQLPGTEMAADSAWVVPDGAAELDNACGDEINHIKAYTPAATLFARIKITGSGSNDASTVLSKLKVCIIE